jgi:hypothetical protein
MSSKSSICAQLGGMEEAMPGMNSDCNAVQIFEGDMEQLLGRDCEEAAELVGNELFEVFRRMGCLSWTSSQGRSTMQERGRAKANAETTNATAGFMIKSDCAIPCSARFCLLLLPWPRSPKRLRRTLKNAVKINRGRSPRVV